MMTRTDVCKLLGVSLRTLDKLRATEEFPSPINPKSSRLLWREKDIDAWLNRDLTPLVSAAAIGPYEVRETLKAIDAKLSAIEEDIERGFRRIVRAVKDGGKR